MPIVEGKLLAQRNRGYVARVRLDIEFTNQPNKIELANESVDSHYLAAIEVGLRYAQERLFFEGHKIQRFQAKVLEVITTTVNTTELMVVYASALAYCEAVGVSFSKSITIDFDEQRISFPL